MKTRIKLFIFKIKLIKTMKKILTVIALMICTSQIFAQAERAINESGVSVKTEPKKAKAHRKGWDGTVKGGSIQIVPTEGGVIIIFPNNVAFKVNEAEEGITETKIKPSDLSSTTGQPIGGIIVKGGKNPGGQMKVISPNASNTYDLPTDWANGEYALTIAHEVAHTEQQSATKAKSVIIKFIVRREQNNYEIAEQSIVNTTKSNTKD
jgi:hypothetical protein